MFKQLHISNDDHSTTNSNNRTPQQLQSSYHCPRPNTNSYHKQYTLTQVVKTTVMSSVVGLCVEETVACIPAHNWVAHLFLLASDYTTLGTLQDLQLVLDL